MGNTDSGLPRGQASDGSRGAIFRWECPCQEPPVLLATYGPRGRINIKVRDRYWHVVGQVQAICPRCGAEHILDLRGNGPNGDTHGDRAPGGAGHPHPGREAR